MTHLLQRGTRDDIIIAGKTANENPRGGESISGHCNNAGQQLSLDTEANS